MAFRQKHPLLFIPSLSVLYISCKSLFSINLFKTGHVFGKFISKFIKIIFFFNLLKRPNGRFTCISNKFCYYFLLLGRHLLRATTSVDPEHDSPGQHPVLQVLQQGQVRAGTRRMRTRGGSQDPDWRRPDRDWREGTLLWQKKSNVLKILGLRIHFISRKMKQQ